MRVPALAAAAALLALAALPAAQQAAAEGLEVFSNSPAYAAGQPLFVYGQGLPGETLIMRVFAPDGTISKFDQVDADEAGAFTHVLMTWPEPSPTFPYGTYTVEVISAAQGGLSQTVDVRFTSSAELVDVPVERHVSALVFAPETAAVGSALRVFVQTTSDGLLIGSDPAELLGTTHVHLPDGGVDALTDSFRTLHQGLYYVDYTPEQLGTYVFHVVTFHQGTVSHGSAATTVLSQDIGDVSDQLVRLNSILDDTAGELDRLRSEVAEFGTTLEGASGTIDSSVGSMTDSVTNIEAASVQLNSLLFPVMAFIAVTVAMQIAILARRR